MKLIVFTRICHKRAPALFAKELDTGQKQQVKELARETRIQNPEIMIEVMSELKKGKFRSGKNSDKPFAAEP